VSRVFLSYAREDASVALKIFDWLNQNGWQGDVFLDDHPEYGISGGRAWRDALRTAAERCEAVIVLISRHWLASPMCWSEFELAEGFRKAILPIVLEGDLDYADIPDRITNWYQLINWAKTPEDEFHLRLAGALSSMGTGPESFPLPPDAHPYPGLGALIETEAALFFGRDLEVMQTTELVRDIRATGRKRMLVILGASGSGKSSLLRAGLWPRLARDDRGFLVLPVIRPGDAVLSGETGLWHALARALAGRKVSRHIPADFPRTAAALARKVGDDPSKLDTVFGALRQAAMTTLLDTGDTPPDVVIPVDQAEELFNSEGCAQADTFLSLLRPLLTQESRVIVVLTLRSDMIPRQQVDTRIAQDSMRLYSLPPMAATSLPQVIGGPAERMGLKVDPLLTAALLTDTRGADALPLLAFTLRVMYDGRLQHDHLTLADYEAMGGVRMAIDATARRARNASLAAGIRPEEYDALLRHSFIPHLVRINETGQPARRMARWADINASCHVVLRNLVDQRLLVAGTEGAEPTIEIAHEAVLREWPEVAGLVAQHRDYLAWREQVSRQQADYEAGRGDLLTGRALAIAAGFADDYGADLSAPIHGFVTASQAAVEAERAAREAERDRARQVELEAAQARADDARRAARRVGAFAAAAVVLALGMGYAMWQANRAGAVAEAERLAAVAARAEAERAARGSESLRLAAVGHDLINTSSLPAGRAVAWLALPHDPALSERPITDEAATAVYRSGAETLLDESVPMTATYAPQRPFLVLVDQDSPRVRLLNTVTGQIVIDQSLRGWVTWTSWDLSSDERFRPSAGILPKPVFSPSGDSLTLVHGDGTAEVWSTRDGTMLGTARYAPNDAAGWISRGGSLFLRQTADGRLIVVHLRQSLPDLQLDRVIGPPDPEDFENFQLDGLMEHPEGRLVWLIDRTRRNFPSYSAFDGTTGAFRFALETGNDDVVAIDPLFGSRLLACGLNNATGLIDLEEALAAYTVAAPASYDVGLDVLVARETGILLVPQAGASDDEGLINQENSYSECAVSADGLHALTSFGDRVAVIDLPTGEIRDMMRLLPPFLDGGIIHDASLSDLTQRRFGPAGISGDGTVIHGLTGSVSPTGDRSLVFHDATTGRLLARIEPASTILDYLSDNHARTAVIETADGGIAVWDVATGAKLVDLVPPNKSDPNDAHEDVDELGEESFRAVQLEPEGNSVIVETEAGLVVHRLRPDGPALAQAENSTRGERGSYRSGLVLDTQAAVLLGTDGGLVERRLADGTLLAAQKLGDGSITRMALSASGVIAAGWDGALSLIDPDTLDVSLRLQTHAAPVTALAVAGSTIATGSMDGTLALWYADLSALPVALSGHDQAVSALTFLGDGAGLLSSGHDGRILWHNVATGGLRATLAGPGEPVWALMALAEQNLAVAAIGPGKLTAWSLADATATDPSWSIDFGSRVRAMAARPEGGPLALGLEDGRVIILNSPATAAPADRRVTLNGHRSAVVGLAFLSENGSLLASLSRDRTLRLWNVETGHLLGVWGNSGETPISLVAGFGGRWIAILFQNDLAEFRQLPAKDLRAAIAEVGRDLTRGAVLSRETCDQLRIADLPGADMVCSSR
jgi:WD40 repeat protein